MPLEVDLSIVAARRPELLELTLRSFHQNLLRHLRVRRLYANIDPIWGSAADAEAVKAVCRLYFSDTVFREPSEPSFCAAVQWCWSQSDRKWFLHLEDDWCLVWRIDVQRLLREMQDERVGQISFFNHGKAWRRGVWSRKFTTSPSLIRSIVGRAAAQHMNTEGDPEKQLYDGRNPALMQAISAYRHRFHGSRFAPKCIVDTGREWRDARSIVKHRTDGVSTWTSSAQDTLGTWTRAALDKYEKRLRLSRFLPRI
ncbi:MAG: hypothetical protein ACRED5_08930 [Propylenella sp.]